MNNTYTILITFLEGEYNNNTFGKDKLDLAFRNKIMEMESKNQKEAFWTIRLENMSKKQKVMHNRKMIEAIESNVKITTPRTLTDEESDIYQAYQLILSEHYKRSKKQVKQKSSSGNPKKKRAMSTSKIDVNSNTADDGNNEVGRDDMNNKINTGKHGKLSCLIMFYEDRMWRTFVYM